MKKGPSQKIAVDYEKQFKELEDSINGNLYKYELVEVKSLKKGDILVGDIKNPHWEPGLRVRDQYRVASDKTNIKLSTAHGEFSRKYDNDKLVWKAVLRNEKYDAGDEKLSLAIDGNNTVYFKIQEQNIKTDKIIVGDEENPYWDKPIFAKQLRDHQDGKKYWVAIPRKDYKADREKKLKRAKQSSLNQYKRIQVKELNEGDVIVDVCDGVISKSPHLVGDSIEFIISSKEPNREMHLNGYNGAGNLGYITINMTKSKKNKEIIWIVKQLGIESLENL